MISKLTRGKIIQRYKIRDRYYHIIVDGTGLATSRKKYNENCLVKKKTDKKGKEYEEYSTYVLEAKLVVGDIVISIDSEFGKGSMFILRIPLTLAIVDGMKVQIGKETYIIPALNIKEVFTQGGFEVVKNPNGEEHSIIRGECYKVTRLSEILGIEAENKDDDIMILVETEIGSVCILVDKIIGQQHVVIKPIPPMLTQFEQVQSHMSGCSILEDGSISLILDANAIINM